MTFPHTYNLQGHIYDNQTTPHYITAKPTNYSRSFQIYCFLPHTTPYFLHIYLPSFPQFMTHLSKNS
jgi:hypothetical protein